MATELTSGDARQNAEQQLVTVLRRWGLVRAVCLENLLPDMRRQAEQVLAEPAAARGRRSA